MTAPAGAGLSLVFGASGYVGSHLVERLLREGRPVRAAARRLEVLQARGWQGAELVAADALAPATLPTALAGVRIAYYLVHSMAAGRGFGRLDLEAAGHFAAAAAQAGVERIVYLGGLVPRDADSEHLLSRRDTGERLRAGPVPVTEVRAGIVVGAGSAAYEVMRDLVNHLPMMLTPRWVRSTSPPIALDNLLEYLVRLPLLAESAGRIFDAGGPEQLSYEDMMRRFGAIVGRRPPIVPVPVLSPAVSALWLGLVTTVPASIGRALIGGLKHDIHADSEPLRRLVPQRLLGFDEAVRAALRAEHEQTLAARWTEGRLMFRGNRQDHAFYAKRTGAFFDSTATPASLWRVISTIGGDNRYYTLPWLWWLREAIDWALGGPGFSRGRRSRTELRLGDTIDYWTVIAIDPGRRLTLYLCLKAPGSGVLEFEVGPVPPGAADGRRAGLSRLSITAYWHPRGFWGMLYWFAMTPAHLFLFQRMSRAMSRRAVALDAAAASR